MRDGLKLFYHLKNEWVSIVVDCRSQQPVIAYFGATLSHVNASMLGQLDRHEAPASLSAEPVISLSPSIGTGYLGHPAIALRKEPNTWQFNPRLVSCEASESQLVLVSICEALAVEITHCLRLDRKTSVVELTTHIKNLDSESRLSVDRCLMTVPIQDHLTEALELTGRWGYELQQNRFQLPASSVVRENRTGRTSHHLHPSIRLLSNTTSLHSGDAVDIQLAWSGNHTTRIEQLADGRRLIQAGELLEPGELELGPGTSYASPSCFFCFSNEGISGLTQQWHRFIRARHEPLNALPHRTRPVQLNTWEACYFDVNEATVIELIDQAAVLGIERFVLDDGWFEGRNNDQTSLGDWQVDRSKFPAGLTPVATHCHSKGLEFGLWIEPEMVSRKSELYRAHPDWVLGFSGTSLIEARHQLVLDLGREEVVDYLFESISTLLTETPIGYLKWDMNRDIHQMENAVGQRAVHQQTTAVYALMARIRKQFPYVEMESCASGGGRLDMGVLQHATRFWPSDTNDALDRIRVQTGFLSMMPPELMGSHVGPSPCHLTGRQHSMAFRAGIALWGHMGVEADIRALDERERTVLEAAINLHKQHRLLLHRGRYVEHEASAQQVAWSVVSADQTEAISGLALMETPNTAFPKRMRFLGIDAAKQYRVNLVWPQELSGAQAQYRDSLQTNTFGGDWLQQAGLEPPIMRPESILIYHLTAT